MSLQIPHREKQPNGVSAVTKAVILVSRGHAEATLRTVTDFWLPRLEARLEALASGHFPSMSPRFETPRPSHSPVHASASSFGFFWQLSFPR